MAETMMVAVELLPCAAQIEAHPGDRIMVFNGTVVGVCTATETPVQRLPAPRVAPHEGGTVVPQRRESPAAKLPPKPPKLSRRPRGMVAEWRGEMAARILPIVHDHPGIASIDLVDALGFDRHSPDRWRPREVLKALVAQNKLRVKPSRNPKTGGRYWLTHQTAATEAMPQDDLLRETEAAE